MSDAPAPLHRTPLYDWHVAHHGRMVEFGGWDMPVQYTSIVEEHHAVRRNVGLFDISHMGRYSLNGPAAEAVLDSLVTCSVLTMKPMQVRYGLVCRPDGGILDDVLIYRWKKGDFGIVVNAGNRPKLWDWFQSTVGGQDCKLEDLSQGTSMLALQGPRSVDVIQAISEIGKTYKAEILNLGYYRHTANLMKFRGRGRSPFISRTGYTGEDGYEFVCAHDGAVDLWEYLLELGTPFGIQPCGLGARDTLRLEAAMPLYGHELSETIDPLTAGLAFAVKLDKPDFIGKEALLEISRRTDRRVRVGLELAGRRIAREGCAVYVGDALVGEVTSGTFSPTLERSIAMAYLSPTHSGVGTAIEIDVRGKRETASVAALPFYKRPR